MAHADYSQNGKTSCLTGNSLHGGDLYSKKKTGVTSKTELEQSSCQKGSSLVVDDLDGKCWCKQKYAENVSARWGIHLLVMLCMANAFLTNVSKNKLKGFMVFWRAHSG